MMNKNILTQNNLVKYPNNIQKIINMTKSTDFNYFYQLYDQNNNFAEDLNILIK
jgi:hypothetical protein